MNVTYVRNPVAGLNATVVSVTETELVIDTNEPLERVDAALRKDGWVRSNPAPVVVAPQIFDSADMSPPDAALTAARKAAIEAKRPKKKSP